MWCRRQTSKNVSQDRKCCVYIENYINCYLTQEVVLHLNTEVVLSEWNQGKFNGGDGARSG